MDVDRSADLLERMKEGIKSSAEFECITRGEYIITRYDPPGSIHFSSFAVNGVASFDIIIYLWLSFHKRPIRFSSIPSCGVRASFYNFQVKSTSPKMSILYP